MIAYFLSPKANDTTNSMKSSGKEPLTYSEGNDAFCRILETILNFLKGFNNYTIKKNRRLMLAILDIHLLAIIFCYFRKFIFNGKKGDHLPS